MLARIHSVAACIPYDSIGEVKLDELQPVLHNRTNSSSDVHLHNETENTDAYGYSLPFAANHLGSVDHSVVSEISLNTLPDASDNEDESDRLKFNPRRRARSVTSDGRTEALSDTVEAAYWNHSIEDMWNLTSFNSCVTVPELGRLVPSGRAFQVLYSLRSKSMSIPDIIRVRAAHPLVMKFVIKENIDTGGTLRFAVGLIKGLVVSELDNFRLWSMCQEKLFVTESFGWPNMISLWFLRP